MDMKESKAGNRDPQRYREYLWGNELAELEHVNQQIQSYSRLLTEYRTRKRKLVDRAGSRIQRRKEWP